MPDLTHVQSAVLLAGLILLAIGIAALAIAWMREALGARAPSVTHEAVAARMGASLSRDPVTPKAEAPVENAEPDPTLVEDLFAEIFSLRVSVAHLSQEVVSLKTSVEKRNDGVLQKLPLFRR